MKQFLIITLCSCLFLCCKTDQKKDPAPANEKQGIENQKFASLEPLPTELMLKLYNEATYIDYIFYNLPFSISQDDKPSIHANVKLISTEKLGPIAPNCKPIGREFFHIGGTIAYEAEIYFQEGCFGYVFLEKEKPIYANKVSESGKKFYSNLIKQALQIQNKAMNGG